MHNKILCVLRSMLCKLNNLIIELMAEEIIKINTSKGILTFRIDFKQLKKYLNRNVANYAFGN